MRRNADENGDDLPLGVKAVYKHFYMDDGLPSTDSREEAIEMRKQMTELLRRGGFRLHKWLTNDPDFLATIPEQDRSPRFLELSENKLPTDRAWASFGMPWKICSSLSDSWLIQVRRRGRSWAKHSQCGIHQDSSSHSQSEVK